MKTMHYQRNYDKYGYKPQEHTDGGFDILTTSSQLTRIG